MIAVSRRCLSVLILPHELLVLLVNVVELTFFPKKMLEIVSCLYLLLMCQKYTYAIVLGLTINFDLRLIRLHFDLYFFLESISVILIDYGVDLNELRIQHSFTSKDL